MFRFRVSLARLIPALGGVFAALLFALPAHAAPPSVNGEPLRFGSLRATVWDVGEVDRPEGKPVVLFSHGFHGCPAQSRALMQAIAKAGYVVFAPIHRDSTCPGAVADSDAPPEIPFAQVQDWTDATYRSRVDDLRTLVAALKASPAYEGRLDWGQVGLMGHSLGGYTVLGMGGAWPSWRLDGVKAVLALSPYAGPLLQRRSLSDVTVPVMLQGGTMDGGTTPTLLRPRGTYDQLPNPKYMVEFEGASHGAWADGDTEVRDSIAAYSIAFLDRYVRDYPPESVLTRRRRDVTTLRFQSELGSVAIEADAARRGNAAEPVR